ncbi:MAG: hypothetical protein BZY80_05945 [SAR202 cluster bacterium Io17-Chloro-G2]|nr:MAG: hypothetical protein BZY80_05945 [SAR202 cluster bacterium Io17-Chloro-G2]
MLYTASYYVPEDWLGQAYRVSRGHPRGRKTLWETLPFLYPSRGLLQTYQSGALDFAGLEIEYRVELASSREKLPEFQAWLDGVPSQGDFTLLCFERAEQPCHRMILAQWLLETVPSLEAGELR